MRRLAVCVCAVLFVASASAVVSADIRSDQRVRFQLGGAVGKLINMFGGKGAREGVTSTVAVKGNRKATLSDSTGQIIDLSEEKIYDLDIKRKTYKVTTFAELRAEMEKARREAEQQAREMERGTPAEPSQPSQPAEKDPNQKEFEVDFDLKNTGAERTINGFNTTQTVMTITVREKGKTLNEAGGMVMTTDMWLTKNAPSTSDIAEFDMKYAQKLYGPAVMSGASAQDMAMAMAMYPQIKPALDRMAKEGTKVEGTAILSEIKMEAVPPGTANTTAAALPAPEAPPEKKGRFGGLMGGLKKMAEASQQQQSGEQKPQRGIIMTTTVEMLKLTPDVAADVVAIPAGFKESK
jgi:hypothetical protein